MLLAEISGQDFQVCAVLKLGVDGNLGLFKEVNLATNIEDFIFDGIFEVELTKQARNQFIELGVAMSWFHDLILENFADVPVVVSVFELARDDLTFLIGAEVQEALGVGVKALVYHLKIQRRL